MLKETGVIAIGVVTAAVRATRLSARQSRMRDCLGHIQHELQLERGGQFSVEHTAGIVQVNVLKATLQLRDLGAQRLQ